MANLKEVKNRINSVVSTQQITKAMKMVAAAKLKRAQDRITMMRPYSQKLSAILQNVSGSGEEMNNPYAKERTVEKVLLILVTSDKGLCGAFNSNVFKGVRNLLASDEMSGVEVSVLPIGKKANDFYKKSDYTLVDQFWGIFGDLSFDKAREAAEYTMDPFVDGKYDRVVLAYNEFKKYL